MPDPAVLGGPGAPEREQGFLLIADMESLGSPDMLPPRSLVAVGARAKLAWEVWKNRREA